MVQFAESHDLLFDESVLECGLESGLCADTKREHICGNMRSVCVNTRHRRVEAEHSRAARREMTGVAVCLEADHVGAEDTLQHLLAAAQAAVELATRKRYVQEESDVDVRQALPKEAGEQQQVVVVNQHNISRLVDVDDGISEGLVHLIVLGPGLLRRATISWLILLVVEQREELVFGEASPLALVAERCDALAINIVREPNRGDTAAMIVLQLLLQATPVGFRNFDLS